RSIGKCQLRWETDRGEQRRDRRRARFASLSDTLSRRSAHAYPHLRHFAYEKARYHAEGVREVPECPRPRHFRQPRITKYRKTPAQKKAGRRPSLRRSFRVPHRSPNEAGRKRNVRRFSNRGPRKWIIPY